MGRNLQASMEMGRLGVHPPEPGVREGCQSPSKKMDADLLPEEVKEKEEFKLYKFVQLLDTTASCCPLFWVDCSLTKQFFAKN